MNLYRNKPKNSKKITSAAEIRLLTAEIRVWSAEIRLCLIKNPGNALENKCLNITLAKKIIKYRNTYNSLIQTCRPERTGVN